MWTDVDPATLNFAVPGLLPLLALPAGLALLWVWRALQYRHARAGLLREQSPVAGQRLPWLGDLGFWLFLLMATTFAILALARPRASVTAAEQAGADVVVLLDGSASMHADDLPPMRWQRAQQFVRTLAESLSWRGDRMALALFAYRAAPQVRLTRDPNALLFFLDHLGQRPPFPLEDATSWDTNIEEGIAWGVKLVEADESLFGRRDNTRAFIVVSDGQAWSGQVGRALASARERHIPVHVVGVGTDAGAVLPEPAAFAPVDGSRPVRIRSRLDREALRRIAREGGGDYFELGREPDRALAARLIDVLRSRATTVEGRTEHRELYWACLAAAGFAVACAVTCLWRPVALAWVAASAAASAALLLALNP